MSKNSLERVLSGWDVFFIAVGQIIGAGVIALTGIAIGMTGPSVIFAYLLSAVLVLIVTILIMMAGSVLPAVGAYYAWCSRLSGGWVGSIVLCLILLASVSLSLYGSSFGLYLNPLFPILSVNAWGVVVIVVLFLANLFGLNLAAKVQVGLVVVLVSALSVYAGFAIPKIEQGLLTPWLPEGVIGFVTAVFLLKFATGGAYMIVGLSGEMKNPRRVIPIVMTTATIAVAGIYAFVALASVGVMPWQEMINQPLTVAGQQFLPGWAMTYFLVGGAGLAICTTLNSQFIQLPRTFIVASWDRLIPERLGRLNRYGAPHYILGIMMVVGVVPLIVGLDIGDIARAATISASLPSIFVYWALTRIHTRYPEQYANSMFNMKPVWIWSLFIFSELSTFVGIYFLSRDLSSTVIWSLVIWTIVAVAYYPIRKHFLAKQGFDLDAATSDDSLFHNH
ncbi:MAG TPA: amino acid permease [Gammaproteobacteria bacterium]|nr:amino acid permease [Gammaproteobacteria bacterium]